MFDNYSKLLDVLISEMGKQDNILVGICVDESH